MARYIKPTLKTKYHIDFRWWTEANQNFHSALLGQLCEECRDMVEDDAEVKTMDWIDPQSAEVFTIDQLWYVIRSHCSQSPSFLSDQVPLTTAIFRLFISNNNSPLTPTEIHHHLQKKDARLILRTIGGRKIYNGIRPVPPPISD